MSKHKCDFCQEDIASTVNEVTAIISYLPCFHAICQKCKANRFFSNDSVSCIVCNYEPFQSEIFDLELPDSNKINCLFCPNNFRERVEFCCESCNFSFVCRNCVLNHEIAKHNVKRVQHELLPRSQCSSHQNIPAIALCSCKTRLCKLCISIHVEKTKHVWKPILAVAQTSRQNLANLMNNLEQDVANLQITLPILNKNKVIVKEMASKARNAVASEIVELCNTLIRRGNDIVTAIDLAEETKLKTFVKLENDVKFAQERLKKIEFFIDMALNTVPTDLPGTISANVFAENAYSLYNIKRKQMQPNIDMLLQNLSKIQYSSDLTSILSSIKKFGQINIDGILTTPQATTSHNARMFSVTNTLVPNITSSMMKSSVNIPKSLQSKIYCFGLPLTHNSLNDNNEIPSSNFSNEIMSSNQTVTSLTSSSLSGAALAAIARHQYEEAELKKKREISTNISPLSSFGTQPSGSKLPTISSSSMQNNGLLNSKQFLPVNPFVNSVYFQHKLHHQQHAKNMVAIQRAVIEQQKTNSLLTLSANNNSSLHLPTSTFLNNSSFSKSLVLNSQQQAMAMAAMYSNNCFSNVLQQQRQTNLLQNQLLMIKNGNTTNINIDDSDKLLNIANELTNSSRETLQNSLITSQLKNNIQIQSPILNQQASIECNQTKTKNFKDVSHENLIENFSSSSIESNENQENENLNLIIEKPIEIDNKKHEDKKESNEKKFEKKNENLGKRKRLMSEDLKYLENEIVSNDNVVKKSRFFSDSDDVTLFYDLNKEKTIKKNNEKENKLSLTNNKNEISVQNLSCEKQTENNFCQDLLKNQIDNKDLTKLSTSTITSILKNTVPKIVLKKKNNVYAADIVPPSISFNSDKTILNDRILNKLNETNNKNGISVKANDDENLCMKNKNNDEQNNKDCVRINESNQPIIQHIIKETHNNKTASLINEINESDRWDDYCFVCNQGCDDSTGLLGCCASCTHVFHNKCHIPAIREEMSELPDDWKCSSCIPCSILNNSSTVFGEQEKLLCSKVMLTCFKAKPDVEAFSHKVPRTVVSYYELIKNPISFDIIAERINSNFYKNVEQFISDLNLLFQNCSLFNAPSTPVAKSGRIIYALFRDAIREYLPYYVNNVWIYVSLRNDDENTKLLKRNLLKKSKRESSVTKIASN